MDREEEPAGDSDEPAERAASSGPAATGDPTVFDLRREFSDRLPTSADRYNMKGPATWAGARQGRRMTPRLVAFVIRSDRKDPEVTVVRLRLALAGLAAVGLGLAMFVTPSSGGLTAHPAVADPMLAKDAKTWKELLTEKEFNSIVEMLVTDADRKCKAKSQLNRVAKPLETSGRLLAALGNIGTLKYEGEEAKKAAALRDAGTKLAEACKAKNFDDFKAAITILKAYPGKIAPADAAETKPWKDLIDLHTIMKAVNGYDGDATNAVKDAKGLPKVQKEIANKGIMLAVLAVLSRDHEEKADWQKWCDDMREESIGFAKVVGKGDAAGAKKAYDAVTRTCNACHEVYRKDE